MTVNTTAQEVKTVQERFNKLYSEVLEQIKNDVPYSRNINKTPLLFKSITTFGKCQRITLSKSDVNGFFKIYLNEYLMNCTDDVIRNTIAHELIHTCRNCFDHKTMFKHYANYLNLKYGYNIARTSKNEDFKEFINKIKLEKVKTNKKLYKVTCLECGRTVLRQRKINVNAYTCTCGGKLKIEQM